MVIPELEEAAKAYVPNRYWSTYEEDVLRTYYGRVPKRTLARFLGRTVKAVERKVESLEPMLGQRLAQRPASAQRPADLSDEAHTE